MVQIWREGRRSFFYSGRWCALILVAVASGCTSQRTRISQEMLAATPPPVIREQTVEEAYHIGCPDVVEVSIAGIPGASGRYTVNSEGRIALAVLDNPRVEGHTSGGLAHLVATELDLPPDQVHCRVLAHGHSVVFVHGPIEGGDRAILYRGPENVVSFIRRSGGLMPGADVRDIHVVRGNVARGVKPQVFTIDLEGILLRGEAQTNVLLQPFDEIFIGELSRSRVRKAMPQWLKPLYRGFCGVFPALCAQDNGQSGRALEP